jgi:hypothetical protein
LDKICNIAILLGFVVAIAAAFVTIPNATALLLVLGAIGALNTADKPELRVRIYCAAIVLILGAKMLAELPAVGAMLAGIFTGVGALFVGASVVALTLAVAFQVKNNLMKA